MAYMDWNGLLSWGVGSVFYAISAFALLLMWRDEQFGLTFVAELNRLGQSATHKDAWARPAASIDVYAETGARPQSRYGKTHAEPDRMSLKSVCYVELYCLFGVLATMIFFCECGNGEGFSQYDMIYRSSHIVAEFAVIHLAVAVRSALPRSPKLPPWRSLHLLATIFVFALGVTLLFHLIVLVWQS